MTRRKWIDTLFRNWKNCNIVMIEMKAFRFLFCFLVAVGFFQNAWSQRIMLDRAKKAIYQQNYNEAKEELNHFLAKNNQQQNNVFLLLSARCYGDPESPMFQPDTAYKIVSRVVYYPSTFDPKMDNVVCKNYQACLDTVKQRKEQYAGSILQSSMASADPTRIKNFIHTYGNHTELVATATSYLEKTEFAKAVKADKILLYSNFIEQYPKSEHVEEALKAIERLKYERVVRLDKLKEYEKFLEEFPNSIYKTDLIKRMENVHWQYCLAGNDIKRYREYLAHYPETSNEETALRKIEAIQWEQITTINEVAYYRWFIRTYPKSSHVQDASSRMHNLQWALASVNHTIEGYQKFIKENPDSFRIDEAKKAIQQLERVKLEEEEESDAR